MLRTLAEKVRPEHTALIVVDVQNDFCHSEGVLAKRGPDMSLIQEMVPRLQQFLGEARRAGVSVIFIQNTCSEWTMSEVWQEQRRHRPEEARNPCWEGTWGAAFYQVAPLPQERVVTKHRYSAFIHTDLNTVLRAKGIKTLIMTGVATNVCVESTARDGFMLDYYIVFLKDCCATTSREEHETTLRNIERYFGVVATTAEVVQAWQEALVPRSVS